MMGFLVYFVYNVAYRTQVNKDKDENNNYPTQSVFPVHCTCFVNFRVRLSFVASFSLMLVSYILFYCYSLILL